jgi:hypothetical protein
MSVGVYGTSVPASVSPDDMEIWYRYTPSRDQEPGLITKWPGLSSDIIIENIHPEYSTEIFGGLYTLRLPVDTFGTKGIYTIIIKPVEIRTTIKDCSNLAALPDVKGLVLDSSSIESKFQSKFENDSLIGYRIEYLNNDGTKRKNFFRIITSNNKASSINTSSNNTTANTTRYIFNDNSSLVFCTITPSSSSSVKPNALPYIGVPDQNIIITNTFFNPIMMEIEMVEHDNETIAYALYGNQTKSLDDGIYTIYNFNEGIYRQYNLYEVKDKFSGKPLYEVREEKTTIDQTKDFKDITDI